jgi:hypothetical protein
MSPQTSKYPRHEAALAYALEENRQRVVEIPRGSNRGPRVEHYQSFDWIPGGGYPWCVDFAQAAWAEGAGHPLPWKTAGAYDLLKRARAAGWVVPIKRAIPGDLLVWNVGSGHASMLREAWHFGGLIRSVDGNVSDSVGLRERPVTLLAGAIHVPEKVVRVKKTRPPMFQVVTSESGHTVVLYVSGPKAISRHLERLLRNHKGGLTIRRKKR